MQSEQLLNHGTLMKRIHLHVKEGSDFEDTTHSLANRKANKNVGKESVGCFICILLAIIELSMQIYGKMSRQACHAHQLLG